MYYKISDTCTVLGKIIQKPEKSFSFLAYLLQGEKNVLIDTVPERAGDIFISELKQLLSLNQLDALILNHSECYYSLKDRIFQFIVPMLVNGIYLPVILMQILKK